jgi:manganese/zinc/iron transport system substrate-binding protein
MKRRLFLLTLLAPLCALVLAGCPAASGGAGASGGGAQANLAGRKIRVTTTVGMVADIVRNVGGDRVEVTALMGPGIDPHYYKATSGDVSALNRADIIFTTVWNSKARWAKSSSASPKQADRCRVEHGRPREPAAAARVPGTLRPAHLVRRDAVAAGEPRGRKHLREQDPGSADTYRKNAEAYRKTLGELHEYVKKQIATLPPPPAC